MTINYIRDLPDRDAEVTRNAWSSGCVVVHRGENLDRIARANGPATHLDLTNYGDIEPEKLKRLVASMPSLVEVQLPPNSPYIVIPQQASARQLADIPRLYPHALHLDIQYWETLNETRLNEIIPQLHELTNVHMNADQSFGLHTFVVPCNAGHEYFRITPLYCNAHDKLYFAHWQYAKQFWYFIEKDPQCMRAPSKRISLIAPLLSLSQDIASTSDGFTPAHRFLLHAYIRGQHGSPSLHQAIAALQALHPQIPIEEFPELPETANHLKAFFHMYPGTDISKLAENVLALQEKKIFDLNCICDAVHALTNIAPFSQSCRGQERFTAAQLLRLQDFAPEEIACLKFLHPDLFAKYPETTWKKQPLENFFLLHSHVALDVLCNEYQQLLPHTETHNDVVTILKDLCKFSNVSGLTRLTPVHYLKLGGFCDLHANSLKILKIVHPHVRDQLKFMEWETCLELIFLEYPQCTLAHLRDAYKADRTHNTNTLQILEWFVAFERAVTKNDFAAMRTCNSPFPFFVYAHAIMPCLAANCNWPRNNAWNLFGLRELALKHIDVCTYRSAFCNVAQSTTPIKHTIEALQSSPSIIDSWCTAAKVSDAVNELQQLLPLETAIDTNDAAAAAALDFSAWEYHLPYFTHSSLWNNDEIKAIIEAKLILTKKISLGRYYRDYKGSPSIERVLTQLCAQNRHEFQDQLLRMKTPEWFYNLMDRFPEQRAAIQKMQEEWHRVHVTERQSRGTDLLNFTQDHPRCEHQDLVRYSVSDAQFPFIFQCRAALHSNNIRTFATLLSEHKSSHTAPQWIRELFLPLSDLQRDTTVRYLLLYMYYSTHGDNAMFQRQLERDKKRFCLLTRQQYAEIYNEVQNIIAAVDNAPATDTAVTLHTIDAHLRPIVGKEEAALDLSTVQHALNRQFADMNTRVRNQLDLLEAATTLGARLTQIQNVRRMLLDDLQSIFNGILPRRSAEESYSLQLLCLLNAYRIIETAKELKLQVIEESASARSRYHTGGGDAELLLIKYAVQSEFFSAIHTQVQALRKFCRLLTPQQHGKAYAAAEEIIPTAQKELLRHVDTLVRFEVDPAHMARGNERLDIPPAPAGSDVTQLRTLLRTVLNSPEGHRMLHSEQILRRRREVVDSKGLISMSVAEIKTIIRTALPEKSDAVTAANTVEELQQIFFRSTDDEKLQVIIELLIYRIAHKTQFFAVPSDANFDAYYETITRALCATMYVVRQAPIVTQVNFFMDILEGIGHCGIRQKYDMIDVYKQYALQRPRTPTSCIDTPLGELRASIAEAVPGGAVGSVESILPAMHFMRNHGEAYGIPGATLLANNGSPEFADIAAYDDTRAITLFRGGYNAAAICEWVNGLNTEEFRDYVLAFHRQIPAGWRPSLEMHGEIGAKIRTATDLVTNATHDRTIMAALTARGIPVPAPETRTPAYRTFLATEIATYGGQENDAIRKFRETAQAELQRQIQQNATDSQLYTALCGLRTPQRTPFACPKPQPQPITSEYRALCNNAIKEYALALHREAYMNAEVIDPDHPNQFRPQAIIALLVANGVLRAVV